MEVQNNAAIGRYINVIPRVKVMSIVPMLHSLTLALRLVMDPCIDSITALQHYSNIVNNLMCSGDVHRSFMNSIVCDSDPVFHSYFKSK